MEEDLLILLSSWDDCCMSCLDGIEEDCWEPVSPASISAEWSCEPFWSFNASVITYCGGGEGLTGVADSNWANYGIYIGGKSSDFLSSLSSGLSSLASPWRPSSWAAGGVIDNFYSSSACVCSYSYSWGLSVKDGPGTAYFGGSNSFKKLRGSSFAASSFYWGGKISVEPDSTAWELVGGLIGGIGGNLAGAGLWAPLPL